jgi:hypothetical protein
VAVGDELARLIALKDAGHLSDEEFQAAKDAVLGQSQTGQTVASDQPTAVIPVALPGDNATPPTQATSAQPTRRSRRPLAAAAGVMVLLLAGGGVLLVTSDSSESRVTITGASPTSIASSASSPLDTSASPDPSQTQAPTPSAAPAPPVVTSTALLAALKGRPLAADPEIPPGLSSASSDYTPPGDSVPSARLLGGVSFTIDGHQTSGVDANILIFDGPQDAAAQNQQELATAESGGAPYSTLPSGLDIIHCSPKGDVCLGTVGRAAIRSASYSPEDNKYVLPSVRAAIRTVAAARAAVASKSAS